MFVDLLSNELGHPKDIGKEFRYNCPFCEPNQKYKFYVHVADDGRKDLWNCFKCGERGNPVSFVMKYYQVGFQDALDILEGYDYNLDKNYIPRDETLTDEEYLLLVLTTKPKPEEEKEEIHYVPPMLPQGYKRLIDNLYNPEALPFFAYLNRRGFTMEDVYTHNIGYVTSSWVPTESGKTVHLENHLVFLTHGENGEYLYWNTRAIGESFVKSINAPSKENEYSKKNTVFNLNRAKRTPYIVINEGVPDALTIGESGVGTFGKQVTDQQVDLILKDLHPEQKIFILLDNDAKEQIKKLGKRLYARHENTFFVDNPTGKDANDLGREASWDMILNHSYKADDLGYIRMSL